MKSDKISKFEKFDTEVVPRSALKNAPYNPRVLSDDHRKRLKAKIQKHGLVAPITWNRRTGNIVGGHQRIAVLDQLNRSQDYELTVAVIDVDEVEEKAINIQLNNDDLAGDWDLEALGDILLGGEVTIEDVGFSMMSVDFLFGGDERFSDVYQESGDVKKAKTTIAEMKEESKQAREKFAKRNNVDFYFMVVCGTAEEKAAMLTALGLPKSEEYVAADVVERNLKPEAVDRLRKSRASLSPEPDEPGADSEG